LIAARVALIDTELHALIVATYKVSQIGRAC
jgi:hypothetical protein